jgi:pilus assembly protein CpaF
MIVQIARFSDGTRRVSAVTEVVGMEGELMTMQDVFVFEKTGVNEKGRVLGRFRATGIRPKFYDRLRSAGIQIPASVFQTIVEIG